MDKWMNLIEDFESKGYQPEDVAMRVFFYKLDGGAARINQETL